MRRNAQYTPSAVMDWLKVASLLIGVVLGVGAVILAGRRNAHQPVEADVAGELEVLKFLEKDPAQYARALGEMQESDYTNEDRRNRYRRIVANFKTVADAEMQTAIMQAAERQDENSLGEKINSIREKIGGEALTSAEVLDYLRRGESVLSMSAGRGQNTERSRIEETGDDNRPHRRLESRTTFGRLVLGGLLGGLSGVTGAYIATQKFEGAALYAGVVTLLLVGIGGIVVGAVDFDTFYLDTPVFWAWAGSSWGAAVITAWIDGYYGGLIVGLSGAIGVAVGFEVVARTWGKLRRLTQGAGDTWIVICTAGVPASVVADWRISVWSILAGAIGAAGHWGWIAIRRGADKNTPVPFGPWLVAGAWAAMIVWLVGA